MLSGGPYPDGNRQPTGLCLKGGCYVLGAVRRWPTAAVHERRLSTQAVVQHLRVSAPSRHSFGAYTIKRSDSASCEAR